MKRPVIAVLAVAVVVALVVAIVAIFRPFATGPGTEGEPAAVASFGSGEAGKLGWLERSVPAPDAIFSTGEGQEVDLADFAGKVVLLNFWATWCAPCVREMPALDRLQADLGGERFEVVAISSDREGTELVLPFYREHALENLGVYLDPTSAVGRAFGIRGLPTTVLIDSQGREVARKEGPAEWDAPEIKGVIRSMTGQ